MKKILFLNVLGILFLAGCAQKNNVSIDDGVGFFAGFVHGVIIIFSFIGSLFSDNISIYEVINNGKLYDLGYVLGVSLFGSQIAMHFLKPAIREMLKIYREIKKEETSDKTKK